MRRAAKTGGQRGGRGWRRSPSGGGEGREGRQKRSANEKGCQGRATATHLRRSGGVPGSSAASMGSSVAPPSLPGAAAEATARRERAASFRRGTTAQEQAWEPLPSLGMGIVRTCKFAVGRRKDSAVHASGRIGCDDAHAEGSPARWSLAHMAGRRGLLANEGYWHICKCPCRPAK